METFTIQVDEQQLAILNKALQSPLIRSGIDDVVRNCLGYTELDETLLLSDLMQSVDDTDIIYDFTLD